MGSFPTIFFYPKDNKGTFLFAPSFTSSDASFAEDPELYEGERTAEAFVAYMNEKCGTQRSPKGGLNEQAGRLPDFDTLAEKFFDAQGHARVAIFAEAEALAKTVGPAAKHYIKVMEKVVNGSEEYLAKETKR